VVTYPFVDELLALPAEERDAWLAAHPGARIVHVFDGLLQEAEADPAQALALTDFVAIGGRSRRRGRGAGTVRRNLQERTGAADSRCAGDRG